MGCLANQSIPSCILDNVASSAWCLHAEECKSWRYCRSDFSFSWSPMSHDRRRIALFARQNMRKRSQGGMWPASRVLLFESCVAGGRRTPRGRSFAQATSHSASLSHTPPPTALLGCAKVPVPYIYDRLLTTCPATLVIYLDAPSLTSSSTCICMYHYSRSSSH